MATMTHVYRCACCGACVTQEEFYIAESWRCVQDDTHLPPQVVSVGQAWRQWSDNAPHVERLFVFFCFDCRRDRGFKRPMILGIMWWIRLDENWRAFFLDGPRTIQVMRRCGRCCFHSMPEERAGLRSHGESETIQERIREL